MNFPQQPYPFLRGMGGALRRVAHRLRTEGAGHSDETLAVALGVFVGSSPFYGLHLTICLALSTLFGLNRLKVYLAANLANPIVAPFLLLTELQTGAWLRSGRMHSLTLETVTSVDPWVFGADVLIGWIVVGTMLAAVSAAIAHATTRDTLQDPLFDTLARRASDRYVGASMTGWEFARAKLRRDWVYKEVLFGDFLPSGGTLADIGCGQGLMLAMLVESAEAVRASAWPVTREPPPVYDRMVGIETRTNVARLATTALGGHAEIVCADARTLRLEGLSTVLLFDVLQMMSKEDQETLLTWISKSLEPGGVMLVREANSLAGWQFTLSRVGNRLKSLFFGAWRQQFCYRSPVEWLDCFRRLGLEAEVCAMSGRHPFGNVLFRARKASDQAL